MPQNAYNQILKSCTGSGTIEYFVHASDTNGRSAGYAGYVLLENGVYYARTAHGSLGKTYRTTDLGAHISLDRAKKEVDRVFQSKLKKNYREDYNIKKSPPTAPPVQHHQETNKFGIPETITMFSHYTPGQVDIDPYTTPILFDEKVVFEWYPNRMRFKIYGFYKEAIGIYNISGKLEEAKPYPIGYANTTKEFLEIANNGLLFLGYTDPNDNIVLLRYISEGYDKRATEVFDYSKQRNIMLMTLYTLTDYSGVSINDIDSPIYINPKIVLTTDKEQTIKHRVALNRFANNLVVFEPNDNMSVLNCIER